MPAKINLPNKNCLTCNKEFGRESCKQISDYRVKKYCSQECYKKNNTGENHWYWRGGVKTRPDGYIRDSKTDRYIHRMVMEAYLGRELTSEEHIHHINGDNQDNRLENLQIMTNSEHRKLEALIAPKAHGRFLKKER